MGHRNNQRHTVMLTARIHDLVHPADQNLVGLFLLITLGRIDVGFNSSKADFTGIEPIISRNPITFDILADCWHMVVFINTMKRYNRKVTTMKIEQINEVKRKAGEEADIEEDVIAEEESEEPKTSDDE